MFSIQRYQFTLDSGSVDWLIVFIRLKFLAVPILQIHSDYRFKNVEKEPQALSKQNPTGCALLRCSVLRILLFDFADAL